MAVPQAVRREPVLDRQKRPLTSRSCHSRFAVVLGPTSCRASQRPIHSLIVISPAPGSVQVPARTFASWSRPQPSAACFGSKPDWLASPPGTLYFTRHGLGPLPRFSAYAMSSW